MRRLTSQRKAILQFLKNTSSHPTADSIYEGVRRVIPNVSKGTVYRNLKVLLESGQISELNLKGTVTRYEGNTQKHYHFRCEVCGKVYDIDAPVDRALDEKVALKTGFKVTHHQLEFRGICKKCQQV